MRSEERNQRRWRNRPLVRERDAQRARGLWITLLLVVAALAPAGIYLYEQNSCLQLSYEIESIERQQEKLAEKERRLAVEQAEAGSMRRIERWAARQRLTRTVVEEVVVVPHETVDPGTRMAHAPNGATDPAPRRTRRVE